MSASAPAGKSLYRKPPGTRDPWRWVALAAGAAAALFMVPREPVLAAIYAVVTFSLWWKLGRPKPPSMRVTAESLEIREEIYPWRPVVVPLSGLERVVIAGPERDRRFFFYFRDGEAVEVRPLFPAELSARAVVFLRESLPEALPVEVKAPPGFMEAVRGNYP